MATYNDNREDQSSAGVGMILLAVLLIVLVIWGLMYIMGANSTATPAVEETTNNITVPAGSDTIVPVLTGSGASGG